MRVRLLTTLAAALALLLGTAAGASANPSTGGPADWPQFQYGPAHTGFQPNETVLTPATVGGLHKRATTINGYYQLNGTPVVANGTVCVAALAPGPRFGVMLALDARTGAVRWAAVIGGVLVGSPAVDRGVLYVSGSSFRTGHPSLLVALNATTGAKRWVDRLATTQLTDPTIAGGLVYLGVGTLCLSNCRPGHVEAFSAATGAPRWTANTANAPQGTITISGGGPTPATSAATCTRSTPAAADSVGSGVWPSPSSSARRRSPTASSTSPPPTTPGASVH